MKTLIGWGYCLLKTDWREIWRLSNAARGDGGFARLGVLSDLMVSTLYYKISPSEYFYFCFHGMGKEDRLDWAGTTAMWMAQRRFVPKKIIPTFSSKQRFREKFDHLMAEHLGVVSWPYSDDSIVKRLLSQGGTSWFFKPEDGQCGAGGFIIEVGGLTVDEVHDKLRRKLRSGRKYIVERTLINHEALRAVNPSCLNTVRVVTYTDGQEVEVLFSRVRFGNGEDVDNLSLGGYAAEVDSDTGRVMGEAVNTSSGVAEYCDKHPISGIRFDGIEIPHWDGVIQLAKSAALVEPRASIVGWDVAVTNSGVYLVEGNHNWGKLLWQLPVRKGLRSDLDRYIERIDHAR